MTDQPAPPAPGRNGRWINLGVVGVDSASLAIVDPAYANDIDVHHNDRVPPLKSGPDDFGEETGCGVRFWAGFGDGSYDVWAWVVDYGEGFVYSCPEHGRTIASTTGDECCEHGLIDGPHVDERVAQVVVTMIDDEDLAHWRNGE